ncbi:MAG: hypothetical protein AMXMBFR20_06170 [Planctomycetia bacterium]
MLGQTEIENVRFAEPVDEDIARLQVAVDHAALMGAGHCVADLDEQANAIVNRRPIEKHIIIDGVTVDEFHREILPAVDHPAVSQFDDVIVIEM